MIKYIKVYLKKLPQLKVFYFYYILKKFIIKITSARHHIQKIKNKTGFKFKFLGSYYGGWTFVEDKELYNSTIISAGLGEDASFDIEFASAYNANVIIIDPTPRAVEHFKKIKDNIGKENVINYRVGGTQDIRSYNTSKLSHKNLSFINKALWNKKDKVKFFLPKEKDNISHSIINFQNNYSSDTSFIEVETLTLMDVLKLFDLEYSKAFFMRSIFSAYADSIISFSFNSLL